MLPKLDALVIQSLVSKLNVVNSLQYLDLGSNQITYELTGKVVTLITSNNYVNLEQLRISKLVLHQNDVIHLSNRELNIRDIKYLKTTGCVFNSSTWNFLNI